MQLIHSIAVKDHEKRKQLLEEPCVVISPAGMLVGGNATYYLQELSFDSKNGIALVSYQGDGTPGKKLLDTGKVIYAWKGSKCCCRSKTV